MSTCLIGYIIKISNEKETFLWAFIMQLGILSKSYAKLYAEQSIILLYTFFNILRVHLAITLIISSPNFLQMQKNAKKAKRVFTFK